MQNIEYIAIERGCRPTRVALSLGDMEITRVEIS